MSQRTPGCVLVVHTDGSRTAPAFEHVTGADQLIVVGSTAAEVNAALHAMPVPTPLVVVLLDEATNFAAALALGQRSAGRRIAGYCLVDPPSAPISTGDWPDAPVCVAALATDVDWTARMARLHGWEFLVGESPAGLTEAIRQWGLDRRNDL